MGERPLSAKGSPAESSLNSSSTLHQDLAPTQRLKHSSRPYHTLPYPTLPDHTIPYHTTHPVGHIDTFPSKAPQTNVRPRSLGGRHAGRLTRRGRCPRSQTDLAHGNNLYPSDHQDTATGTHTNRDDAHLTNMYKALHTLHTPLQRPSRYQSHVYNHPHQQRRLHSRMFTTVVARRRLHRWRHNRNYRPQRPLPRLSHSTGLRDRRCHRDRVDVMYHAHDHPQDILHWRSRRRIWDVEQARHDQRSSGQ